ncbi:MAG: ATP-binding cassette domain-containing protein [Nitriliruptorales bacterium]|nr:ATP-binding cassette domain-containing protein [Nitriliruptorales bacterium]
MQRQSPHPGPPAETAYDGHAESAVLASGLTKHFSSDVVALDDVNVEIAHGEFVTVVGPSGCGKSTLLRLFAGLLPPTDGQARVFGEPVKRPRPDVAMMFQEPTLLSWRTALENVVLPHELGDGKRRRGRRQEQSSEHRALELLQMLGLGGFEHAYPPHLSGGMQQRVALARLLITGARMLLLDEPFGALDEFTRERLNIELMEIFGEFKPTTLLVTHSISEAVLMADRVLVMTPSPGRLAGVLPVSLPRPRTIEMTRTEEFNDVVFQARGILGSHVT